MKEEIGLGIVCTVALLFIFYGIGKFIITCIRDEKFIKKADLVYKNAENEYNKFIEFLKSQELLKESISYFFIEKCVKDNFISNFEPKILEDTEDTLERYNSGYNFLMSVIHDFKNKIERIKVDISYNISHWYKDINLIPVFFVLESIYDGDKTYCYSTNLHFKHESQDIVAYIFSDKNKNGYVKIISPKDYKILPMTKNDFYNKYLIGRINLMNYSDFRDYFSYKKDLINEFNKNFKNE